MDELLKTYKSGFMVPRIEKVRKIISVNLGVIKNIRNFVDYNKRDFKKKINTKRNSIIAPL